MRAFTLHAAPPGAAAAAPRRAPRLIARRAARPATAAAATQEASFQTLADALEDYKRAPPSFKQEVSADVMAAMTALKEAGALPKFGVAVGQLPPRRQVALYELKSAGIKEPSAIGVVSVRNDLAFLVGVVGVSSVLAVVLGQLPGQWGFWGAYGSGGISIVVLAVGSTAPNLLQLGIDLASQVYPDYRARVRRHEAAHFLLGYLLGVPVAGYSLLANAPHTDFAEGALQKRLIEGTLDDSQVDRLAVVAVAGAAGEATAYDDVVGQNADLQDLQKIMNRADKKLGAAAQQNLTRWAVSAAATLLRRHAAEYAAAQEAMAAGADVLGVVRAIEAAAPAPAEG